VEHQFIHHFHPPLRQAYVQQLESSNLKLAQLEQELQRARQQVCSSYLHSWIQFSPFAIFFEDTDDLFSYLFRASWFLLRGISPFQPMEMVTETTVTFLSLPRVKQHHLPIYRSFGIRRGVRTVAGGAQQAGR
jgi:hypothetical protein